MTATRFLKTALGGALLTLGFAFLSAAPMHTAPQTGTADLAVPGASPYHVVPPQAATEIATTDDSVLVVSVAYRNSNDSSGTREAEQFFFNSANHERAEQGLPQLKWDEALAGAARKHAALMADQNELSHRLPGEAALDARVAQAGARFSSVGENVAIGPESPEIHTGWMHSPGHRANILGVNFNALGVGVVERDGQLYAVEDFSRAVENLSLEQQEKQIAAMLTARGFKVKQSAEDLAAARKACAGAADMARSVQAPRGGMAILRFETPDLSSFPAEFERSLHGPYSQAVVGACRGASENGIPRFRVVVFLFS
jgi:uncharacterized protein YkwD